MRFSSSHSLPSTYRTLWVSWNSTHLAVGQHATFRNELLALDATDIKVEMVSLVSGAGHTGEWIISQQSGASSVVCSC